MGLQPFDYTDEQLNRLEYTLSLDRLSPYLQSVGGDRATAIKLYCQNTLLSESLYGILQGLEVALRNSFHAVLAAGFGQPDWFHALHLEPEQSGMLKKAEDALNREGKPLDPGRLVAELPFGFWTGLTGPKYATLWKDHIVKAFPKRSVQRTEVQIRLNTVRKLRNRVAHHEPILGRDLERDVNQILDTIAWMCPVTARWVRSNSSFTERFAAYRKLFPRK